MARANNLNLAWNPSLSPNLAGYNVYFGTNSGSYIYQVNAGNSTSTTISNLAPGTTYYIAATAYDTQGNESPLSGEISYTVLSVGAPTTLTTGSSSNSSNPGALQFLAQTGHWYEVQATTDLINWTSIWQSGSFPADTYMEYTDTNAGSYSSQFYRLIIH